MFNAQTQAKQLVELQQANRKKRFQSSKLDPYTYPILALYRIGVTLSQLRLYLELNNVKVARSTIHYWLKKHGEIRLG